MGALDKDKLKEGLEKQNKEKDGKKIGEILVEEDYVNEADLDRALEIQTKFSNWFQVIAVRPGQYVSAKLIF